MDDIIRMAREAGFNFHHNPDLYDCMVASDEAIKRFASLVTKEAERKASFDRAELWLKRINEAVAEEREACAKWYENAGWLLDESDVADAIRART